VAVVRLARWADQVPPVQLEHLAAEQVVGLLLATPQMLVVRVAAVFSSISWVLLVGVPSIRLAALGATRPLVHRSLALVELAADLA
jgi:hypothetical protein